jgi:Uma2 family endonuclease
MRAKLAEADQMTIEEFLAYMDTRPDGERWELIEGVAVMNASPTQWHQVIASNIVRFLMNEKAASNTSWLPLLGVGTRVPISPNSLPQPDVYVQEGKAQLSPITDDAAVLFEVLSKSNTKSDRAWRKRVYTSIPNCQHYVTVSVKSAEVVRFDRSNDWEETKTAGLDARLVLSALRLEIPLLDIYRWTPIK